MADCLQGKNSAAQPCPLTGSSKRKGDTKTLQQTSPSNRPRQTATHTEPVDVDSSSGTGLAFSFPGWDVKIAVPTIAATPTTDFLKDLDELEGQEDPRTCEVFPASLKASTEASATEQGDASPAPEVMDLNAEVGCSLVELPIEVFVRLAKDLSMQALVSLGSSCSRLHRLTLLDELWQPFAASTEVAACAAQAKGAAAGVVGRGNAAKLELVDHLRWLSGFDASGAVIVRSNRMAVRAEQQRVLRLKFLQVAEQALAAGGCFEEYLHGHGELGLQQHLARHLASADRVDGKLLSLWRSQGSLRLALCELWLKGKIADPTWLRCIILQLTRFSWSLTYEALCGAFFQLSDAIALELRARLTASPRSGVRLPKQNAELWIWLLKSWDRYNQWLSRVVSLCTRLSDCVSAEQAAEMMARGRPDTPSIYDAGKAAFRSQVVLRYGLRAPLQSALLDATLAYKAGKESKILKPVRNFLDEVDVQDDGTAAPELLTRDKLRHVFGLEPGPAQLQIRGHLRVPQP